MSSWRELTQFGWAFWHERKWWNYMSEKIMMMILIPFPQLFPSSSSSSSQDFFYGWMNRVLSGEMEIYCGKYWNQLCQTQTARSSYFLGSNKVDFEYMQFLYGLPFVSLLYRRNVLPEQMEKMEQMEKTLVINILRVQGLHKKNLFMCMHTNKNNL